MEKSCKKERTNTLLLIAQSFFMSFKQLVVSVIAFGLIGFAAVQLQSCSNSSNQVEANGDSTLVALNKKIADNPNDYKLYLERATYLATLNKFNEAYDDIARAKSIDSTQAPIYATEGDLHFKQNRIKEAYNDYSKCISKDPNNKEGLLGKAGIDIEMNKINDALNEINTVLKQDERVAYAYFLKGRLYKNVGDTAKALSSFQTAIEVDPQYYDAYISAGLYCSEIGNLLAKDYFNSAIEIRPNVIEPYYNKAMFLQNYGVVDKAFYQEALATYQQIAQIDPNFSPAYFNRGFIYLVYLKDYANGVAEFTKAIEKNNQYFQAYFNRALCYEGLKKNDLAEADLREALRIAPQYDAAAKELSHVLGED